MRFNPADGLWEGFPDGQGGRRGLLKGGSLKDCPKNRTDCQGTHVPPGVLRASGEVCLKAQTDHLKKDKGRI